MTIGKMSNFVERNIKDDERKPKLLLDLGFVGKTK